MSSPDIPHNGSIVEELMALLQVVFKVRYVYGKVDREKYNPLWYSSAAVVCQRGNLRSRSQGVGPLHPGHLFFQFGVEDTEGIK